MGGGGGGGGGNDECGGRRCKGGRGRGCWFEEDASEPPSGSLEEYEPSLPDPAQIPPQVPHQIPPRSLPDPGSHLLVGFDKKDEANAGGKQKDDIVVRAGEVGSEGRQAGGAVCVEEDEQLGGRLGRKLAGD